jgi:hypothetical protein
MTNTILNQINSWQQNDKQLFTILLREKHILKIKELCRKTDWNAKNPDHINIIKKIGKIQAKFGKSWGC